MSAKIDFYTNAMSRGRIAHWMMEELGEPYETHWVDYGEEMKSPGYLAINPMGKVPALVHDGAVVTECAAILTYLAAVYPEKRPDSRSARGSGDVLSLDVFRCRASGAGDDHQFDGMGSHGGKKTHAGIRRSRGYPERR